MPIVKCPTCGKMVEFHANEFRPFCSERCKLLDLGAWIEEEYSLPTVTAELSEEDLEKLEEAMSAK